IPIRALASIGWCSSLGDMQFRRVPTRGLEPPLPKREPGPEPKSAATSRPWGDACVVLKDKDLTHADRACARPRLQEKVGFPGRPRNQVFPWAWHLLTGMLGVALPRGCLGRAWQHLFRRRTM